MASQYEHIKELVDFMGIDLRSSNVARQAGASSDKTRNVIQSAQDGIIQRPGSKCIATAFGKVGIVRFDTVDLLGNAKSEIIGFGGPNLSNDLPYRLVNSFFGLVNNNATHPATVSHYYVPASSQFVFTAVVNGVTEISQGLGTGTGGGPYMLSSLKTAINLTTDISIGSLITDVPAAFLEILADVVIPPNGGQILVNYWFWQQINVPPGHANYATLANVLGELGLDSYRNVSTAAIGNVLYISSGVHTAQAQPLGAALTTVNITKYDGQNFYRAGLPIFGRDGVLGSSATGMTSPQTVTDDVKGHRTIVSTASIGSRAYLFTNICIDKAGNRIETSSYNLGPSGVTVHAIINIPVTDLSITAKGFNNGYAVCSATVTGLTITCSTFQSLNAGDVAFFWDNLQGVFIQRVVTAVTGTTITISSVSLDTDTASPTYDTGANPQVLIGALITNNMRVGIYRNAGSATGSVFYLLEEVPNWNVDTVNLSYTYYDAFDDAIIDASVLHGAWIEPSFPRDFPPPCRYLAAYNSQLILTGDEQSPTTVYFSMAESPEYVPRATHNFNLPVAATGAGQTAEILACFGGTRVFAAVGDLAGFNFRIDFIADQIGCTSHASIQRIDEAILAFQSAKGPYMMYGGRQLVPMGSKSAPDGTKVSRLEPFFTQRYAPGSIQPNFGRALSAILPQDRLYVLYIPFENPAQPTFETNQSVLWVYDWGRDAWWKWDGLAAAGGIAELGGQLYFSQRGWDGNPNHINFNGATNVLYQQQRDKGVYNYADHNGMTNAEFRSHWECLGEPAMSKRFLRCRLSNYETPIAASVTMGLNTYVNYDDTAQSNADVLTWTGQKDLKPKLKAEIVRSMQFAFVVSQYYQPLQLTGFELEAVANFRQEFKE